MFVCFFVLACLLACLLARLPACVLGSVRLGPVRFKFEPERFSAVCLVDWFDSLI